MIQGAIYSIWSGSSEFPILRLFHSVVSPFRRTYEEHRHTAFEISLICVGSGIYKVGSQSYWFCAGDIFLFSSNEPHCIVEVFDECALNIMNLQFEPRFLWSSENHLYNLQYPDVFFKRNSCFLHQLSGFSVQSASIMQQLLEIEKKFHLEQPDYKLMVKLQVLMLLVSIRRSYTHFFEAACINIWTSHLEQLECALNYIDANLTEKIDLHTVARQATMSPAYFSTLFIAV